MPEAAITAPVTASAAAPAKGGAAQPPAKPGDGKAPDLEASGDEGAAFEGAFTELEALDKAPAPSAKPTKKEAPGKVDGQADPDAAAQAAAKKAADDAAATAAAEAAAREDAEPKSVPELRKAHKAEKTQRKELQAKLTQAEARVKELETAGPGDTKSLQEKLTGLEKRNAELEQELEFTNFSQSDKFKKEYQEPYVKAWGKAVAEITQLTIAYEGEDGQPVSRKATEKDLLALANAPLDQLDALAEEWFGRAAARVIRHVEKIRDLADAQNTALEEARSKGTERLKTASEESKAMTSKVSSAYNGTNEQLAKKYPNWFGQSDTDKEGNEIFNKGLEFADSVFKGNGKLTPEQKATRLAIVRNKAANHDRLARRLKTALADLAEARKELAEYEKSGDPAGRAAGKGGSGGGDFLTEANKELESLDKPTL